MKNTIWLVACLLAILACIATSSDIQDLATEQRAASNVIKEAMVKVDSGQLTPQQLGKVVVEATEARAEQTEQLVALKMNKMQEDILGWWELLMGAAAASIPVVYAGMKLAERAVNRKRNATSDDRVTKAVEAILKAKGLG